MGSALCRGVRASQNWIAGNCASCHGTVHWEHNLEFAHSSDDDIVSLTHIRASVAFKFVVVRRLVSLAQPTYMSVTFVEIQHTSGDANESATGGDGNEGPGEEEVTAIRAEMATLVERGTLLAVGDRCIIIVQRNGGNPTSKWRCACLSVRSTPPQKRRIRGMGTKILRALINAPGAK
jgi:hypothetical protein